ncbi:hypothetical protein A2852_01540 [Candidatus Adlerbacteria bacterium RIFCSPHIGHO2_01_FULL_54_23]|uniref:tRNA threonylcarbamoyladenosine biosynthesis protein TsaE n=3 Tax=Candidatus Adleribacteriota TaxID=1752736 RepID=A0A1F4XZE3_9BACT|nr:MAG: putative nucleotide-binding protein [Candidatus Adlerbacteria bacterium GW2011_GWA1_54_10]KKW36270.1 MAG: putative nucleotide-binding protein [Candidatus Adlerbacteria bacterium GW2011_GWA2_54_12]KKW37800.1 MAG: putative nucleotide-binding protein [Candidatus Adlerbacteria bacterium GW2011_GWB1_54_7]OGC78811.1 MAG: hypothetical protein A2852_01540 [Candidatus Adlerbacteria bacterium RIFCSPHIGHO2_01_FULL_54_23]OGC86886.1 MAG: hypothetical protein A3B33_00885 [Candidatus Adlerbacteria bac
MRVRRQELPEFVGNVMSMLAIRPRKNVATVIGLHGELGAGKTTFVQEVAKKLGVGEKVQSPTYVLIKKYQIPTQGDALAPRLSKASPFSELVHIDAYRLNSAGEFAALRIGEIFGDSANLIFIEWPERVSAALPAPDLVIKFSSEGAGESERFIEIEK